MAIGEPRVIQAEQVQDRGVKIVNVNGLFDGADAVLVRGAVDNAAA